MVLNDLGRKIGTALISLTKQSSIDEKALDEILKDICKALLESDVNVKLVQNLRGNIKKILSPEKLSAGVNKPKIIQKAIFDELVHLVDPTGHSSAVHHNPHYNNLSIAETPLERMKGTPYKPRKGRVNKIMFVGLQGAGKTTSCTKFAHYYAKRGWKVALICADTYRAGAFDQLKQNATKARIPFYGSYTQEDPAIIASEGISKFAEQGFEIIIVDTSGRHKQESALFDEMKSIEAAVVPDEIIFVMDGSIGQAADAQASAFQQSVPIGSIIITKMDGGAKGGGAISGVAATGSPIVFIGTGEHIDELEPFNARSFVSKMLGWGDIQGLAETIKDLNIEERNKDLMKNVEKGIFTLKDLYDQFQTMMSMGPIGKIMGMIPGFSSDMFKGSEKEIQNKFKKFMVIMDSMHQKELNSDGKLFSIQVGRVSRVARGSGTNIEDVEELLAAHKKFAQIIKKIGGNNGLLKSLQGANNPRAGGASSRLNQLSSMMPQGLLEQMGGLSGMQNMLSQFGGGGPNGGSSNLTPSANRKGRR